MCVWWDRKNRAGQYQKKRNSFYRHNEGDGRFGTKKLALELIQKKSEGKMPNMINSTVQHLTQQLPKTVCCSHQHWSCYNISSLVWSLIQRFRWYSHNRCSVWWGRLGWHTDEHKILIFLRAFILRNMRICCHSISGLMETSVTVCTHWPGFILLHVLLPSLHLHTGTNSTPGAADTHRKCSCSLLVVVLLPLVLVPDEDFHGSEGRIQGLKLCTHCIYTTATCYTHQHTVHNIRHWSSAHHGC